MALLRETEIEKFHHDLSQILLASVSCIIKEIPNFLTLFKNIEKNNF